MHLFRNKGCLSDWEGVGVLRKRWLVIQNSLDLFLVLILIHYWLDLSGKWAKLSVTYNKSHQNKSHVLGKEFLNLSCLLEHKNSDARNMMCYFSSPFPLTTSFWACCARCAPYIFGQFYFYCSNNTKVFL